MKKYSGTKILVQDFKFGDFAQKGWKIRIPFHHRKSTLVESNIATRYADGSQILVYTCTDSC